MGEIRKYRSRDYHLKVVNCLNSYKSLIKNKHTTCDAKHDFKKGAVVFYLSVCYINFGDEADILFKERESPISVAH